MNQGETTLLVLLVVFIVLCVGLIAMFLHKRSVHSRRKHIERVIQQERSRQKTQHPQELEGIYDNESFVNLDYAESTGKDKHFDARFDTNNGSGYSTDRDGVTPPPKVYSRDIRAENETYYALDPQVESPNELSPHKEMSMTDWGLSFNYDNFKTANAQQSTNPGEHNVSRAASQSLDLPRNNPIVYMTMERNPRSNVSVVDKFIAGNSDTSNNNNDNNNNSSFLDQRDYLRFVNFSGGDSQVYDGHRGYSLDTQRPVVSKQFSFSRNSPVAGSPVSPHFGGRPQYGSNAPSNVQISGYSKEGPYDSQRPPRVPHITANFRENRDLNDGNSSRCSPYNRDAHRMNRNQQETPYISPASNISRPEETPKTRRLNSNASSVLSNASIRKTPDFFRVRNHNGGITLALSTKKEENQNPFISPSRSNMEAEGRDGSGKRISFGNAKVYEEDMQIRQGRNDMVTETTSMNVNVDASTTRSNVFTLNSKRNSQATTSQISNAAQFQTLSAGNATGNQRNGPSDRLSMDITQVSRATERDGQSKASVPHNGHADAEYIYGDNSRTSREVDAGIHSSITTFNHQEESDYLQLTNNKGSNMSSLASQKNSGVIELPSSVDDSAETVQSNGKSKVPEPTLPNAATSTFRSIQRTMGATRIKIPFSRSFKSATSHATTTPVADFDDTTNDTSSRNSMYTGSQLNNDRNSKRVSMESSINQPHGGAVDVASVNNNSESLDSSAKFVLPPIISVSYEENSQGSRNQDAFMSGDFKSTSAFEEQLNEPRDQGSYQQVQQQSQPQQQQQQQQQYGLNARTLNSLSNIKEVTNEDFTATNTSQFFEENTRPPTVASNVRSTSHGNYDDPERSDSVYSKIRLDDGETIASNSLAATPLGNYRRSSNTEQTDYDILRTYGAYFQHSNNSFNK